MATDTLRTADLPGESEAGDGPEVMMAEDQSGSEARDRASLQPDAVLDAPDQGCALLTPLVRSRMRELASGQILEVCTDDPTAEENLGAWSRLTGNELVQVVHEGEVRRRFFIRKK
jgi:TusA-related sulfurtransferase